MATKQILFSWIGGNDLKAASLNQDGPVLAALKAEKYHEVHLLSNYDADAIETFSNWLVQESGITPTFHTVKLKSVVDDAGIYKGVNKILSKFYEKNSKANFTYHLSPGTSAMASVWLLLAKTKYPARLIRSSIEEGVVVANIPFDISAEFSPLQKRLDKGLEHLSEAAPSEAAEFSDILARSEIMQECLDRASRIAKRDVSTLVLGETGTGKELVSRAIHKASNRSEGPFVPVNCGAIPESLIESELFGHTKGAFTGASADRLGRFREADGGTIFLDEFGDLPAEQQVKLLRVLQEKEVSPVGSDKTYKIDVRVIAATRHDLQALIVENKFREDLFYRVAIGLIHLPPLREREGDLKYLADELMKKVNNDASTQPGYIPKKLTPPALNLILRYEWPGNVRELHNTLARASIWAEGSRIEEQDLKSAMLSPPSTGEKILDRNLDKDFDLTQVVGDVASHYINKALKEADGVKKKAAQKLGFNSYQTMDLWIKKYQIELK
jgi:transcriptional regulator with PAS, ATPase and Fis domain